MHRLWPQYTRDWGVGQRKQCAQTRDSFNLAQKNENDRRKGLVIIGICNLYIMSELVGDFLFKMHCWHAS